MAVVSMKQLLEAGVHFGHQTRRWNPKMDKYIYTSRSGIHIIDLQKTVVLIEEAYQKLLELCKNGGKVLFVGTKKQAQSVVRDEAIRTGQYYVSQRWLGGTLTNFKTIRKSIRRLADIERMDKDGTFEKLTKKEVIALKKEQDRYEKFLSGIKEMKTLPEAVFVVDPIKEKNAILEARKLKIPVFGIVDTNCDPDLVDVIIPANDDAIRSVKLIVSRLANAAVEAVGGEVVIEEPKYEDRRQKSDYDKNRKPYDKNRKPYDKNRKPYDKNKKPYVKRDGSRPAVQGTPRPAVQGTPRPAVQGTPRPAVQGTPRPAVQGTPRVEPKVAPKVEKAPVRVAPKTETPVVKEVPKKEAPKKVEVKKENVTAKVESKDIAKMTVAELKVEAKAKGLSGYSKMKKAELIEALK